MLVCDGASRTHLLCVNPRGFRKFNQSAEFEVDTGIEWNWPPVDAVLIGEQTSDRGDGETAEETSKKTKDDRDKTQGENLIKTSERIVYA